MVTEFVTLDGVVEDPGGGDDLDRGGWAFDYDRGDLGNQFKFDELLEAEVQLLGRATYEGFAESWPSREGRFADRMNTMPKFVVSRTLEDARWQNTTVLRGDVVDEVRELKRRVGGVILVAGSAQLVRTLIGNDLVDELRLMVFPVVLGSGARLFGETRSAKSFRLVESKRASDCLILTFRAAERRD